jgi:hypothetical protein
VKFEGGLSFQAAPGDIEGAIKVALQEVEHKMREAIANPEKRV